MSVDGYYQITEQRWWNQAGESDAVSQLAVRWLRGLRPDGFIRFANWQLAREDFQGRATDREAQTKVPE